MEAADRLQRSKKALLAEMGNIQAGVAHDLAVVEHEEAGEAALFDESRRRAVDLNMKEIEYHRLDRSRQENEKLYALLVDPDEREPISRG